MNEFENLLNHIKLDKLIGYLMYGTEDAIIERGESYQDRLKAAYEKLINSLEQIFPTADRQKEDLSRAVMDFSIIHNEVYLEMGLLIGFQLCQNMNKAYQNLKKEDIENILNRKEQSNTAGKEHPLLDTLFEIRISTALEDVLNEDPEYLETRKQVKKEYQKLEDCHLSSVQMEGVDNLVSAANSSGAAYGRTSYRQGFQDGIKLVSELERICA